MALDSMGAGGIGAWLRSSRHAARIAFVAVFASLWVVSNGQASDLPAKQLPVLTTTRSAHSLSYQQASLAYPVRLRGVVTFYDPYEEGHPALFIADATGSIYILTAPHSFLQAHAGSVVEVTGMTDPGGYAPIIIHPDVRIVGESRPLPTPRRVTLSFLLTGAEDGQWVAIEGLVHSVEFEGKHVVLTLATSEGVLTATTVKQEGANYASLVDSIVLIPGVEAPLVDNNKRQMVGVRLLFPDFRAIKVEDPAPIDPFAVPIRPVGSLLQYSPMMLLQHRVHLRGRVTLHWPGRTLCILDGNDGLCVQTADRTLFREGELVDVTGFQALENYEPTLSDATLRPAGNSIVTPPKRITAEEAFQGEHHGELVQIEGRLMGRTLVQGDPALLLSSGKILFPAIMPLASFNQGKGQDSAWVDGSSVLVTGVFSGKVDPRQITRRGGTSQLESFQILLRSPKDVVVLSVPSWWNSAHTLEVLGGVVFVMGVVLVWVAVLRRQVHRQTEVIRQSEERFRHMAEHDGLTGLPVRNVLLERLELAMKEIKQQPISLALLMVDVDCFKQLNDGLGHAAGDQVLCAIGNRLQESVRSSDTVARIGGDEFAVLLGDLHHGGEAQKIASQLVSNASAPIVIDGRAVKVSVSVGVATYPESGGDVKTLLRNSDAALYQAKARGRNCYQIFSADAIPSTSTSRSSVSRHEQPTEVL